MSNEKNIYQRLNIVRQKVAYLQKDTKVQGYKAITHDAVTSAVREPFIEHGVMLIPNQIKGETFDVGQTSSGTTIIRYEATYEIRFVNIDKPDEIITCNVESHALDHGDKAPGKAMSYAVKYAMLKVLNIETGESDESRYEMAQKQKKKLVPETDMWEKAVTHLYKGKIDVDFLIDNYDISKKHLVQIQQEVKGIKEGEDA